MRKIQASLIVQSSRNEPTSQSLDSKNSFPALKGPVHFLFIICQEDSRSLKTAEHTWCKLQSTGLGFTDTFVADLSINQFSKLIFTYLI